MSIVNTTIQALLDANIIIQQPVVIGVSGGADSLSLMHIAHHAGHKIIVAHLNHELREESSSDAEFVKKIANELNLPFIQSSVDVNSLANQQKLSIEETARIARYQFLFAVAQDQDAQAVLVAHNADDQVETVLMHLLRGTGMDGLRGMQSRQDQHTWNSHIPLVRPLLNVWREDIDTYCQQNKLSPIQDSSNTDTTFFRNKIRHKLIPTLLNYNPQFKERITRTAQTIQAETELIEALVDNAWEECVNASEHGFTDLDLTIFAALPIAIQRRLVRKSIAIQNTTLRDIGFDAVERLVNLVKSPTTSHQIELAANFKALLEGNSLYIYKNKKFLPTSQWPQYAGSSMTAEKNIPLDHGWEISIAQVKLNDKLWGIIKTNSDLNQAWVSIADEESLQLRGLVEGEIFTPFGLEGQKTKLSDYFINAKIPQRSRRHWPILATANGIVWICGLRISESHRVTKQSEKIYHIALRKQENE